MNELIALGTSHKTAGVAVREKIALTEAASERFMRELVDEPAISEAVVLSTCNRTELYLVVAHPVEAESQVLGRLARRAGVRPTELVEGIYSLRNCDAARHLYRVASGLEVEVPTTPSGHAIEFRINAEDPKRFLPGPGAITTWVEPTGLPGVRVDSGYEAGTVVTPNYDSLMAKLIVTGADRAEAIERARAAVEAFQVAGPKSNLPFFLELLGNAEFISGDYDTALVSRMR